MATNFGADSIQLPARWIQIGFLTAAVLFNLCLVAQLLTVGLAIFYSPDWWNIHVWLVRGYSGLAVFLLGWVFQSPFPRRVQMITGSLLTLLILQFITIHLHPLLSVFHPLTGFMLVTVSSTLVHRMWHMVFTETDAATSNESGFLAKSTISKPESH